MRRNDQTRGCREERRRRGVEADEVQAEGRELPIGRRRQGRRRIRLHVHRAGRQAVHGAHEGDEGRRRQRLLRNPVQAQLTAKNTAALAFYPRETSRYSTIGSRLMTVLPVVTVNPVWETE